MPYIGNTIRAADDYRLIDDISSGFNGSTTSFALQVAGSSPVPFPKSPQQVLISVNGVIQEPDPTGASGFNLVGTNIVFSSAPTNGHAFFGIIYATADYLNAGGNFPAGALGSPSITFIGDENTGLYRKGSGSVGFVSDATEIANFDSNGITISSGNLIIPGDIIHSGDTNTKIRFSDTDQIKLETGSVQKLRLDNSEVVVNDDGADVNFRVEGDTDTNLIVADASADKVGIGTGTPSGAKLHIVGSGNTGIKVQVGSSSADQIYLGNTGGSSSVGTLTNVGFNLIQNGGTALAIDTNKKVGIGTTSPTQLLSLSSSDPRIIMTETTNNSNCIFDYASGGVLEVSVDDNDVDSNSKFQVRIDGATAGLTLDSTGLGIGTTSPQARLHLDMGAGGLPKIRLQHSSSGNDVFEITGGLTGVSNGGFGIYDVDETTYRLAITSSGNVGINTTTPAALLTLNQTIPELRLQSSNNNLGMGDFIGLISLHTSDGSTPGAGEVFRIKTESSSSIGADYTTRLYNRNGSGGGATEVSLGNGQGSIYLSTNTTGNATATVKMAVMSSGNVGIGTTSPSQLMGDGGRVLHVKGSDNPEIVLERSTSGTEVKASLRITDTETLEFAIKDGTASTVRALSIHSDNGDIGLGTITPSARLHVFRSTDNNTACILNNSGTTGGHGLKVTSGGTGAGTKILSCFRNNQSSEAEVFRVDGAGDKFMDNVFDKDGNNQRKSYFTITGQLIMGRNAHESYLVFQDVSNNQIGNIVRGAGSSVAYNTTSDYRLKENVVDLTDAITRLKTLSPKRFNFISDPSITLDGFIAHEVTAVPEAVEGEKDAVITQEMLDAGTLQGTVGDPIYQGIDQSKLVPLLVAAVQELTARVETLEAA